MHFIQHSGWPTDADLSGPFLVLAQQVLHSRAPLSLRQIRTIGGSVIYHVLIELEQTLEIRMIPTHSF